MRSWVAARLRDRVRSARRGLADGVGRARWQTGRVSPTPALIRVTAFGAGLVALLLGLPAAALRPAVVLAAAGVAALAALRPGGRLPGLVMYAAVGGWLAGTAYHGGGFALWRLLALAGAVHLLHTTAALAAVVPYDAVAPPGVLRRCLVRAGWTLGLSGGFAVAVTGVLGPLAGRASGAGAPHLVRVGVPVAGAVAVGAAVVLLVAVRAAALRSGRPPSGPRFWHRVLSATRPSATRLRHRGPDGE